MDGRTMNAAPAGAIESHFDELTRGVAALCGPETVWTFALQAESSDFVRFNHAAIRQPGHVQQAQATLRLVEGRRHAARAVALSGQPGDDLERLGAALDGLRALLPALPEDPYLALDTGARRSRRVERSASLDAYAITRDIVAAAEGTDLVGMLTSGPLMTGFASSHGTRHWHEIDCFEFGFSLHLRADKAVKSIYAGRRWETDAFAARLDAARHALALLQQPARRLAPGRYRTYLAPAAVADLLGVLQWGGFSAKEQYTKRSSLQRLVNGDTALHPGFNLSDDLSTGIAPGFDGYGFLRATPLPLVERGRHANAIVSARTGAEYGIAHTGADDEYAVALALAGGDLAAADAARAVGDGLYINNLWYLNYSDRSNARVTGMTRFATLWIENGRPVAPCEVMRFDDSVFSLFGDALEALTREREVIGAGSSYGFRSTGTTLAPGALLGSLALTL